MFIYTLEGVHLALTVLTDFEARFLKVIPFKIHGWVELIVSLCSFWCRFYFGAMESELARNFYIAFTAAVFFTWVATEYKRIAV